MLVLIGLIACGSAPASPWEGAPPELMPEAFVAALNAAVAECADSSEFAVDCTDAPCIVMYRTGASHPTATCPGWRAFARQGSASAMYSLGGRECTTAGIAPLWPAIDNDAARNRAYPRAMALGEQLCAAR